MQDPTPSPQRPIVLRLPRPNWLTLALLLIAITAVVQTFQLSRLKSAGASTTGAAASTTTTPSSGGSSSALPSQVGGC